MKKILIFLVSIIMAGLVCGGVYIAWVFQQMSKPIETIQYDPQLTIYLEGGSNSVVLTSADGRKAIIVDTKMMKGAKELRNLVKAPEVTIINTHFHMDHMGGNRLYPKAIIIAGDYTPKQWNSEIVKQGGYPNQRIKIGEEIIIPIDNEKVHVWNMGLAHSWNDIVVYFEERKLLVSGDLVFKELHPVLPPDGSCNVSAWLKALDDLGTRYDIQTLVPGHGKISDKTAIVYMKDYFISIADSIGNPAKQKELKAKFKNYFSIPVVMSFNGTLAFIEKERKGK